MQLHLLRAYISAYNMAICCKTRQSLGNDDKLIQLLCMHMKIIYSATWQSCMRLVINKMSESATTNSLKLPEKPHQPRHFKFPKREFGKKNPVERSFQSSWFDKWQF